MPPATETIQAAAKGVASVASEDNVRQTPRPVARLVLACSSAHVTVQVVHAFEGVENHSELHVSAVFEIVQFKHS